MNDRIFQKAGDTNVTVTVWLQDALTGALKTSVTIANLDYRYIRIETDNDVTITGAANVVALSALADDHADGKMLEIGEGAYRLDIPDAMDAAGACFAQIIVWDAANDTILPCVLEVQLDAPVNTVLVVGATPITLANIVAAIFAKTGITAGGTWTFSKIIKVLAAWATGKWQDKSGSPGTYEILDPDDGTTVIAEITPSATTPQKQVTIL